MSENHPTSRGAGAEGDFKVLIAGGGVAALEAVLALRAHHRGELAVELACPEAEFTLRPLAVTQPFGDDLPPRLDLGDFCDEHDVTLRRDRIAEVWGDQQRALLDSGEDVFYDALLLGVGATPWARLEALARVRRDAADGALQYRRRQEDRLRMTAALSSPGSLETVMRYEAHLSREFARTLSQLNERQSLAR